MKLNLKKKTTEIKNEEDFQHTFITEESIEICTDSATFNINEYNGGLEIVANYKDGSALVINTMNKK
jgi:hypothetical protein